MIINSPSPKILFLETESFDIKIYNPIPKSTTLKVGEIGIHYNDVIIQWRDIRSFNHFSLNENMGTVYIATIITQDLKSHVINFHVNDLADQSKKKRYRSAYNALFKGFREYIVHPTVDKCLKNLKLGQTIELAGVKLDSKGIEIRTGILKRKTFIPIAEVHLQRIKNAGGFYIKSSPTSFSSVFISYEREESRLLLALLEKQLPNQAAVYY